MNNKMKIAALIVTGSLVAATSVSAFSDIHNDQQKKIAEALQNKGVIQGISADKFSPSGQLTSAQGMQMVVKALKLKFRNASPSDILNQVPASAWYKEAAKIAESNGMKLTGQWNAEMTREDFASMLYSAISATGNYPITKMYMTIKDENQIDKENMAAIQFLLLTKIAKLDDKLQFHPKQHITRMEAAEMTYNAMQFVAKYKEQQPPVQSGDGVALSVEKVNDQINKIVLTQEMANPGYGIALDRIEFVSSQKAIVYYHIVTPERGKLYPQVITKVQTSFYMDSKIQVTAKPSNIISNTINK